MMFPPQNLKARRWRLLWLLAAAAVICAVLLIRSWNSSRARRPDASLRPVLSRPIEPATEEALRRAEARPNPAMQKAGLPDPVARKTAAASAERAAAAAAELAASGAGNN